MAGRGDVADDDVVGAADVAGHGSSGLTGRERLGGDKGRPGARGWRG